MKITNLKLTNFRNYEKLNLHFSNYKNIIIGNNGLGKTNIVEAIYYLSITKSFRTNNQEVLIRENSDFAVIEATVLNKIKNKYRVVITKDGKKIKIDNQEITKLSDYISKVNVVLFNREDMKLIKDNPSVHRKLINMDLSGFNNNYLRLLSLYNKILKQRNSYLKILKNKMADYDDYLDIITNKLIEVGLQINKMRFDYISEINLYLNHIFNKSVKKGDLYLKYVSNYNEKSYDDLLRDYKKSFNRDVNYGVTNIGVHLDDYIFELDGKLAKEYLSEGEQKSAVIAFKLSEVKYCMNKMNTTPILILDDLFSELDEKKINRIIGSFNKNFQIFITTTDIKHLNKKLLTDCTLIKLTEKKVEVIDYE